MVRKEGIYSYAKQFLEEQKLFIPDMYIYGAPEPFLYELPNVSDCRPYFEISSEIKRVRRVFQINDYDELLNKGFYVTTRPAQFSRKKRIIYVPVRKAGSQLRDFGRIPTNHLIEYDEAEEAVRLIGPNADEGDGMIGMWVSLNERSLKDNRDWRDKAHDLYKNRRPFGEEETPVRIYIKEVPVMFTEHEIVCIDLAGQGDEHVIAFVGTRGMGKSTGMNGLASRAFPYANKRPIFMNDKTYESEVFGLPWRTDSPFDLKLKEINEVTRPLPVIHLHLENNNDNKKIVHWMESGFKFSIKFSRLVKDYSTILKRNPEWKLKSGGALSWFKGMIYNADGTLNEDFVGLGSQEDIEAYMDDPTKKGHIKNPTTRDKIKTVWRDIFRSKILDISNDQRAVWTVTNPDESRIRYNPFVACLRAGLVPVNITAYYVDEPYFPQIYSMIAEDILDAQMNDPYFIKNQIQVLEVVDELTGIANRQNKTETGDKVDKLAAEGRHHRIGMAYATQNYSLVSRRIRTNTTYIFAFNMDDNEAVEVVADFSMGKGMKARIKKLRPHEAITATKADFIVYDRHTGERRKAQGPFQGFVLPPLNQQRVPRTDVS